MRRVLVLVNPKSGVPRSFARFRRAMDRYWDVPGNDVSYQFSQTKEDGTAKAQRAVEAGVDTILVCGGDGTVSTVGRVLVGTSVELGAVPMGSGNGFARHFGTPLDIGDAVAALAAAPAQNVDVGYVGELPFLVTCSMAWDAAIVRSFEKWPVRGILPYIFAGVQELFEYQPQDLLYGVDGGRLERAAEPVVFTVANVTQFGGGAQIAPSALADDGQLELVTVLRKHMARLLPFLPKLFDGSLTSMDGVTTRRFRTLTVQRERVTPIQVDGELVDAGPTVTFAVKPRALRVLVPAAATPPARPPRP